MHRPLLPYGKTFFRHATACIAALVISTTASAQGLTPKRALTIGPAPGCAIVSGSAASVARRDNVESRRLAAAGQEAALIGDQAAARDAFARAAVLNPGDERVAYDLARAHEELADSDKAIIEYCRYLTLSPAGREAADVRERLARLVPRADAQRAEDVQVAFRLGLALYDDGRYEAAARAFDDVIKLEPSSMEGYFNRGLSRAASGKRTDAYADLEQYRANAPTVDDRVEVGRAIEVLRRPVYSPGVAALRSVLPGFGQFYTSRPVRGVVAMITVAAASAFAFTSQTTDEQIAYVDPNGVPAPYVRTTTDRPYFVPATVAAVGLTVLAGIEAIVFANGSQRGASITARTPAAGTSPGDISLFPILDRSGRAGFGLSARF